MEQADPCMVPGEATHPIPADLATPCINSMLKPSVRRKVADGALVAYLGGLAGALAAALAA